MNTERFQRVKEIFAAVCDTSAGERCALLDSLCQDQDDLRSEVQALLEHADMPALDIEQAASHLGGLIAAASRNGSPRLAAPLHIGPYRILQLLGEGGMGVVYLAQQERPRRTVAIKVIRPGFATPSLMRRFEHEAHVLGRLQHPGIAQIFDAGLEQTVGGVQPYLVMEYVDGAALLDYANRGASSTLQRVQLMIDVCMAVQHAHLRGVIHRDLKPANILVNSAGECKVLDFGVARVTDADTHATIAPTVQGQLVGTLSYMSPEQLGGERDTIDTRSDVYALGVITYELLAGALPYDVKGRSLPEAVQALRSGAMTPRPLPMGGDLHTIVLKAMSPERERRYQSALELAVDLRRFQAGEPISARRDSVVYVVRKQMRRYRSVLLFLLLALCGATGFGVYALNQAGQNARLALREREAREAAEESEQKALASEQHASRRRDESQAVTGFLMAMLKMADPDITEDYDASVRTLLAEASKQVAGSFEQFPDAEAEIRGYLGRIYATLGDLDLAEPHLRRAIALHDSKPGADPATLYALLWPYLHVQMDLNDVLASTPRIRAERHGRSIIQATNASLADRFVKLRSVQRADVSDQHIEDLIQEFAAALRAEHTPEDPVWLLAADQLHLLGLSHRLSSHPAHAAAYFEGALNLYRAALKETNPRVARTLGEFSEALLESGRFKDAAVIAGHSLEILRSTLPQGHWYIRLYEAKAARAMLHIGNREEAAAILHACHQAIAAARGASSPLATNVLAELIRYRDRLGQPAAARTLRDQYAAGLANAITQVTLEQTVLALGDEYADVAEALRSLNEALSSGDPQRMSEQLPLALQKSRDRLDARAPYAGLLADLFTGWGGPYAPRGLPREAKVQMLHEASRITELCPHRHQRKVGGSFWWLADYYLVEGEGDAAVLWARRAVEVLQSAMPEHDTFIPVARSLLAGSLMIQGRLEESFELGRSSYIEVVTGLGAADVNSMIALNRILRVSVLTGRVAEVVQPVMGHFQQLLNNPPAPDRCYTAAWNALQVSGLTPEFYEAAQQLTLKAGDWESQNARGRTLLAAAKHRLGQHHEAIELLHTLEQGEKTSFRVLAFLTLAYAKANRADEAAASLMKMTERRSRPGASWSFTAEALYAEAQSSLNR